MNGPKLWLPDWTEIDSGMVREFNGIKAAWVAQLNMGDDAEGNTGIMKGFQMGLTSKYTYEEFVAAGQGQFKQLPPGWKFRVKTLEKDLIETPEGGVATIMPDEFLNMYDKTGPGMSNYKH